MSEIIVSQVADAKDKIRSITGKDISDDRAFSHMLLHYIFGYDFIDQIDLVTDGSNDGGIDFVSYDEEESKVIVCQSKYTGELTFDQIIAELTKMHSTVQNFKKAHTGSYNDRLKKALQNNVVIDGTEVTGTNSVYETLVTGMAKCDGISHTFQYLMQKLGVQTMFIIGKIKTEDIGHAWNAVKIEDKWCEIDLTGALSTGNFEYFLGSKGSELEKILTPDGIYGTFVELPDFEDPAEMKFEVTG